jgi:hypothetical protein
MASTSKLLNTHSTTKNSGQKRGWMQRGDKPRCRPCKKPRLVPRSNEENATKADWNIRQQFNDAVLDERGSDALEVLRYAPTFHPLDLSSTPLVNARQLLCALLLPSNQEVLDKVMDPSSNRPSMVVTPDMPLLDLVDLTLSVLDARVPSTSFEARQRLVGALDRAQDRPASTTTSSTTTLSSSAPFYLQSPVWIWLAVSGGRVPAKYMADLLPIDSDTCALVLYTDPQLVSHSLLLHHLLSLPRTCTAQLFAHPSMATLCQDVVTLHLEGPGEEDDTSDHHQQDKTTVSSEATPDDTKVPAQDQETSGDVGRELGLLLLSERIPTDLSDETVQFLKQHLLARDATIARLAGTLLVALALHPKVVRSLCDGPVEFAWPSPSETAQWIQTMQGMFWTNTAFGSARAALVQAAGSLHPVSLLVLCLATISATSLHRFFLPADCSQLIRVLELASMDVYTAILLECPILGTRHVNSPNDPPTLAPSTLLPRPSSLFSSLLP